MSGEFGGQTGDETTGFVQRIGGAVVVAALVIAATGCGSNQDPDRLVVHPAAGKISFKGTVPQGAYVALHSKTELKAPNGQTVVPSAAVQPDGTFAFSSYAASDGAPAGEYALTVEWHKTVKAPSGDPTLGPNLLPPAYSKPETSPVKVTIVAGRNDISPIVLK